MHKVAAIQMCSTADVDVNLQVAARLIKQAVSSGAQLVVLPEMFAVMGVDAQLVAREQIGQGKIQDALSQLAMTEHVWIIAGTIPLFGEQTNKLKAACLVYNSQGDVVARYDKIHLFDAVLGGGETYQESASTESGNHLTIVDSPVGRLGIVVCYDLRFPELFVELAKAEIDVIAVPVAFTVKTGQAHWHLLTRTRALDTLAYVIGAGQSGQHNPTRCTFGHSLIIDPWGNVLCESQTIGEDILIAEISLELIKAVRSSLPVHLHRQTGVVIKSK